MGVNALEVRRRVMMAQPHEAVASGAVASFRTDVISPLPMEFDLVPIQAGTCDPSPENVRPITGHDGFTRNGAGINLLNPDFNLYSVKFAYLVNNHVVPEGATARMTITNKDTSIDASGCYLGFIESSYTGGGSPTHFNWCISNGSVGSNLSNIHQGVICCGVFIYPNTQETFNKLFSRYNIMVELGSVAHDFESYRGVSKSTTFPIVSANKWDEVLEQGRIDLTTGENTPDANYNRAANYCACLPETDYYGCATGNPSSFVLTFYDSSKNYVGYLATATVRNKVFTTPANAYYFRLYLSGNITSGTAINYPSTVTYYNPYGNTVYGGTVRDNGDGTGTLVVDWALTTYTVSSESGTVLTNYRRLSKTLSPACEPSERTNAITNVTKIYKVNFSEDSLHFYISSNGNTGHVFVPKEFTGDVQLCYPLETPITYTLSLDAIQSLIGQNHVWVDNADSITVEYWGH